SRNDLGVEFSPYSDSWGPHGAWLSENTETSPVKSRACARLISELFTAPGRIADVRSGPVSQLSKPVKEVSNIEAKATPKYEQYNSESQQDDSRRDSDHSCYINHTADNDILISHLLTSWPRLIRITSSVDAGHESRRGAVGAFGASNRKDSTPRCGGRLLRCGISTRLCPLWVRSGHYPVTWQCPLYPRKRTSTDATGMSALCQ